MIMRVVHLKRKPFDIRIDRATKYGNPFSHKGGTKADVVVKTSKEAVQCFKNLLTDGGEFLECFGIEHNSTLYKKLLEKRRVILESLPELKGKTLGCWCKVHGDEDCHGDVLVELSDKL